MRQVAMPLIAAGALPPAHIGHWLVYVQDCCGLAGIRGYTVLIDDVSQECETVLAEFALLCVQGHTSSLDLLKG